MARDLVKISHGTLTEAATEKMKRQREKPAQDSCLSPSDFCLDEPPLVVDPFAGGGSIPLEALRVGCDAFGSDLNPVACLILKVLLEDIPRYGRQKAKLRRQNGEEVEADGLAEALRIVGKEIKEKAEEELKEFYPVDPDGSRPIAYLWARTVRCESPNCGAEIPLARSFWLSKQGSRRRALRWKVERPKGRTPRLEFEIFEPKSETEVPRATVSRANATCPSCGMVLPAPRVRTQLAAQRGGADVVFDDNGKRVGGARLLAVATLKNNKNGRDYRLPVQRDYVAVRAAQRTVATMRKGEVPDEPLPLERVRGSSGFRILLYGMRTFGDLFTTRQALALATIASGVKAFRSDDLFHDALRELAAITLSRAAPQWSALSWWQASGDFIVSAFARQALPIVWDFAECVPWTDSSGSLDGAIDWVARVIGEECRAIHSGGQTQLADATAHPLPNETAQVWFTDPPYYDAVAYADLADFFFAWLKRELPEHPLLKDPHDPGNRLTPKTLEAIVDPARTHNGKPKDRIFFERMMGRAFEEGRRLLSDEGVGCVVFAHKSTEGWEALLSALLRGGWVIVASWPVTTEREARPIAHETAALAASIHLVCRPRRLDAPIGGWEDILRELPARIGDWMERLAGEGIRGADLVFSCIGPAMELFSRHPRVETAEGRTVELPEFLEKVWEVVGRTALEQVLGTAEARARNSAAGALEEDARLTALFLWTLQSSANAEEGRSEEEKRKADEEEIEAQEDDEEENGGGRKRTKGYALIYDIARRFAQPLGIHLEEWEGRIIETDKGVVRLLPVSERATQLFGKEGAAAMAEAFVRGRVRDPQLMLFPEEERAAPPTVRGRAARRGRARATEEEEPARRREPTTLDRVHAAMLLQATGQAGALRALLEDEQRRGPDFFRLANALSALYPKNSEEKRLVDAMLLAAPRR